jgi:hypothetical protein
LVFYSSQISVPDVGATGLTTRVATTVETSRLRPTPKTTLLRVIADSWPLLRSSWVISRFRA